ncbi:hypothetical protein GCM10023199_13420 [Actinomycetospora chibensis]
MIHELLDGAREGDDLPVFDDLPCPIRVVWSERDRTIPYGRYGAPMRRALPGAEFIRLPGCGHVPMWDDPELVARVVLQVTAEHDAGEERPRSRRRPFGLNPGRRRRSA